MPDCMRDAQQHDFAVMEIGMDAFDFIFRYFGVIGLGVAALNYTIMKARIRPHVSGNPQLAEEYTKLVKTIILWINLPIAVMAFGGIIGYPPSIEAYFCPRDVNIVVWLFYAAVIFVWAAGTRWIFFQQGAETLAQHPKILNHPITNPTLIKGLWLLCLAGGITALSLIWLVDLQPMAQ